jgi:hypothetical protein
LYCPADNPVWNPCRYLTGKNDRATMRQRFAIAAGIAAGMRVVHEHGFVHFDLKPGNVRFLDRVVAPPLPSQLDFVLIIA